MNKFGKYVVLFCIVGVISFIISCVVGSLVQTGSVSIDGLLGNYSLAFFALLMLGFIIYVLAKAADGKPIIGKSGKEKKDKKPKDQFFDSEWLTEKELDKKYDGCFFRELHSHADGVPIRAQLSGNGIRVNLLHQVWHTLVIGTTGSGKTAGFINPTIQILSSTKSKPSLVITDVKGELYRDHYNKLVQEGYEVMSFDLRNPFASTRWNPMTKPFRNYQRALNLKREVYVHRNDNPADCGLQIIADVYNNEWYEFEGVAHPNRESIERQLNATKKQLMDSAFDDLKDIAITLCPVSEGTNDASWQQGAQDFILGMLLCMLEDSADPRLGMTEEKYNFFNLYKVCNTKDPDPDKQYGTLQKYVQGRSKLSTAVTLAGPIVNNSPLTARSFFGMIANAVNVFADSGVCYATSADEMDFSHFADRPTALFIKVPFEKKTRHPIAQLLIISLYKTLVEKSTHEGRALPRHVYYVMDEFANMPKIQNLDAMITVSRGIGICLLLVVQDYAQISINYGESIAEVIKSNCNVHIFLGTENQKTKEEFSTRCGQTSVESKSTSESKSKGDTTKSTNVQKVSRALITPDELGYLKEGEMIVSMFKEKALKSQFTFSYKASHIYNLAPVADAYVIPKTLDEERVFYDIKNRNKIVLNTSDFDDF